MEEPVGNRVHMRMIATISVLRGVFGGWMVFIPRLYRRYGRDMTASASALVHDSVCISIGGVLHSRALFAFGH